MKIADNITQIKQRMERAATHSGRTINDVELVAVSKKVDVEAARAAIDSGVIALGESRVQEARRKFEQIGSAVEWHMIGPLQSNKAKYCPGLFYMIHSVDRLELFKELDRQAKRHNLVLNTLLQVNVSGEEQKSGCELDEAERILKEASTLSGIKVKGLMTIPPFNPDPEDSRPYYKTLADLKMVLERAGIEGICLEELSMGMSGDYEVAIEEGATLVRVGTSIFGQRA